MSKSKICDRCGTEFDPVEAEETFTIEHGLFSYENFKECLCSECAGEVIDDEEEDSYFEICDKCGKQYNPFVARVEFDRLRPAWCNDGYDDWVDGSLLCEECAFEYWEEAQGDDDAEDEERLSVDEVAEIWLSNGKDEDYTFGYSEEVLEEALRRHVF